MTDKKSRAALYVRQSRTTEGSASMAIQVESCRQTAARFDIPIVHDLCERPSTSGYRNRGRDRPQFLRLLELIRQGEVDCVIVYKSDRLSRGGGPGYAPLLEAIETAGHDPNRFILHADGWLSEFELGIRAAIDREESQKISSRMLDVRAREAREGKPRGCRGYGYLYSKDTKQMTVVPEEAAVIRECTQRILDGDTVYSVVKDLNGRRIPTAAGGRWRSNTLLGVLRSPRIAGLRSHLGEVVGPAQWEGIITEDEHHRLTAVIAHRHRHRPKRAARTFPLIGFLHCGKCGAPLRSIVAGESEGRRRRYACRGGEVGGCGGIQIHAPFIEAAVRDYVLGVVSDPELRDKLLSAAPTPENTEQGSLLAELRHIDTAQQRLTDLAVEGGISPSEVRRKNEELSAYAARLQQRLADLPAATAIRSLACSAEDLAAAWETQGIDFQRTLIALLIDHITVSPARQRGAGRFDADRLEWSLRA